MELNIHEKFNATLKEMMARKAPKDEIQKLIDDYRAQKDATVNSPESKTEVKKDDFVSSIPGLKEKLVKTQETKTSEVSNLPENVTEKSINRTRLGAVAGNSSTASTQFQKPYVDPITGRNTPATYNPSFQPTLDGWNGKYTKNKTKDDSHLRNVDGTPKVSEDKLLDFHMTTPYVESQAKKKKNVDKVLSAGEQTYRLFGDEASRIAEYNDKLYPTINNYLPFEDGTFPQHNSAYGATQQLLHIENSLTEDTKIVQDRLAESYFGLDGFVRERVEGKKSGIGEGAWIARKFDNMVQGLIGEPEEKYYKNSEEYDLKNFFARKLDDGTASYDKYDQYLEWKETGKFNPSWMDDAKKSVIINRVRQEKSEQHINDYPNNSEIKNTIREIKDNNIIAIFEPDETNYIAEYKEAIEVDKQRLLEIQKLEGSFMNWTTTDQEKLMSLRDKESEKSKVLNKYYEDKFKEYETEATDFEKDHKTYEDFYNKYNPLSESIEYRFKQLGEVNEYSSDEKKEKWNKLVAEFNELKASYDKDFLASGINEEELFKRQDALNNKRSKIIDNFDKTNNSLAVSRALALDYNNTNYFSLSLEQVFAGDIGSGLTGALKLFAFAADKVMGYGELLASGRNIGSRQIKKVWNTDQDGNLTKYRNLHNAQISYKESMENYKQTAMPLTIPWKDVNMNNMLEWSGRALSDNVFSIGTALSYGTAIGLGARIPQATKVLSGIFFSVEAGSKLGQMEIEQKNAPKNIAELKKAKELAVTNDERVNIQSQIDYQEKALDATEMEKAFSSIMYGGIAMYAERLGTLSTLRNLSRVAATSGGVSVANTLKGSFQVAKGAATEYVEETVTQIGHNIVDNVVVGQNKSLLDGIDADFNANVIFSSLAIMGPSVSANVYNSIRSEVITQAEIAKNRQRQKDLVEVMEPLQNDKKSGGKLLDKANRDFLESEGERILREASLVDATMFADIADMTASELKELFSVNQKKRDKLNQLRNLGSQSSYEQVNSSYIEKQKQKITNELNELNGKRDQLRGKPSGRRKEAIEKSIKEKDKIQVDTEFYLGRFHGNMNIVKGLAGNTKTFGKVLDDGTLDLTDLEKYLDKKVEKGSITEEEKKDYLKGFRGGNYASFVGNDVIVIQHNVIKAINEAKTSLEKSMIAYAPLHELQHINDINSGLIVDNEVVESQAVVIQGVENEIETLYEQGKITEENYIIIKNRINSYARNNDELRNKAALSRFGERFENLNKAQQDEVLKIYPKRTSVDLMELLTIAGELKDAGILSENSTDLLLSLKLMINGLSNRYFKKGAMFFKLNSTSDVLGYIDSFQRSARSQNLILGPEEEAKNAKFSSALESINNLIPSDIKTKEDYQEFVRDRKRFAPLGKALEENGVISNYVKSKSVGDEYVDAMESVTDRVIGLRGTFNPERLREDGTKVGKEAFGEFIFANTNFAKRDAKKALAIRKIESDKTTSIDTKEVREIEDQSTIDESTSGRSDGDTKKTNVLNFTGVSSKINELMDVVDIMPVGSNTFKTVDEYTGKAAEIIFDIPAEKATKGNKNLSHKTKVVNGMMELSQAGKIQDFFRVGDNLEKLVKIMVPENVTSKTADISEVGENIDVARDIYGRSIGLKGKVLEYFFDKTEKRSQGLTTQPNVWELKPEFKKPSKETLEQLRADLGITPQGKANVSDRAFNGQLLKGIAEYQAYQTALSITQRKLDAIKQEAATKEEKSAISQDIANVTAAQSKAAFSAAIKLRDADSFKATYQVTLEQLGDMIGYKLARNKKVDRINSKGKEDFYQTRDLDALLVIYGKETGETIKQGGIRVVSDFLNINPEFRGLLRTTLTGGETKSGGFFQTTEVFDELFPATDVEQIAGRKKYTNSDYVSGGFNQKYLETYDSLDENKKLDALYDFFKAVEEHLNLKKGKPNNAWFFLELIRDTSKHQNTFTRALAPFGFWPVYKDGNVVIDEKVTEEHTDPQNLIGKSALAGAIFGEVDFVFKVIRQSYMQGPLLNSEKFPHDKIVNKAGFEQSMPNIYYEKIVPRLLSGELNLPSGYASIVRLAYAVHPKTGQRIDLNMYMLGEAGMTITQYFGVDGISDIAVQNKLIVDFLAGDVTRGEIDAMKKVPFSKNIETGKKTSAAVGFSRTVNPAKGISVLDFDDTLATTKSGVRYTLPNPDGLPQPKKKVIFMAGGPGSGKSNVINQLGLKEQGFKVVNQDISLEWLMKNHGMPTDMREFTPEQASEFGKLSVQAREIALKKRIKYQGEGDGVIIDGTGASLNVMKKNIQDFKDKGYDVQMIFVETSQETALSRNKARKERSLRTGIVIKNYDSVQANKEAYKELFGERFAEVNTDNLKQGDVMPADIVNKVNDFTSGYIKGRLNAGEYAIKGEELRQQGAEFDFSEFNQVVEGKTAPLFNKAMKLQEKFTSKDMFVLTARPAESNQAIFEFLQANGLKYLWRILLV
jgi:predicted kinase